MPGRVKHRNAPTAPKEPAAHLQHRLHIRQADGAIPTSAISVETNGLELSKTSVIWLSVIGVVVLAAIVAVAVLMCRCRRRGAKKYWTKDGRKRYPHSEIIDGRNDHWAWNGKLVPGLPLPREGARSFSIVFAPPMREKHDLPKSPLLVEHEVGIEPVLDKDSRRSRRSKLWGKARRVSQIGREI